MTKANCLIETPELARPVAEFFITNAPPIAEIVLCSQYLTEAISSRTNPPSALGETVNKTTGTLYITVKSFVHSGADINQKIPVLIDCSAVNGHSTGANIRWISKKQRRNCCDFCNMETSGALSRSCTMCTKSFTRRSALFCHILTQHTLERPYRCSHCKSDFNDRGNLKLHILRKHQSERTTREGRNSAEGSTDERPQQEHNLGGYLCEISYQDVSNPQGFKCAEIGCSYIAMTESALNNHMPVHSPERPFGCSQCSSGFKRSYELRRHLHEVHFPKRLFECSKCSSTFTRNDKLGHHLRDVHSSERPFGCSKCSSLFKAKDQLSRHLLHAHSTERPFGCTKCSSRFKSKDHLRGHLRHVHSSERPFGCPKCSSLFKAKDQLSRHLLDVHSPERPFKCSKCSSGFKRKYHLSRHLSQVHIA